MRQLNICEQHHKKLLLQSAHQTNQQKISSKIKAKRFLRHQKKLLIKQKKFFKLQAKKSQQLQEKLLRKPKNLFRKLNWHSSDHKKKHPPIFKIMSLLRLVIELIIHLAVQRRNPFLHVTMRQLMFGLI
jgi:hypothetical protein